MNELYHHGIKGQRWGKRRFQNEDGSLTPQGRARYNQELIKAVAKKEGAPSFKPGKTGGLGLDALGAIARQHLTAEEQKKLLNPNQWDEEDQEYAKNNPRNYAAEQQDRSRVEADIKNLEKTAKIVGISKDRVEEIKNDKWNDYWEKTYSDRSKFEESKKQTDNVLKQAWDTVVGSVNEMAKAISGFFGNMFKRSSEPTVKTSTSYKWS